MKNARTSLNGSPSRNGHGRFTKGNRGGPGNPNAKQVARLRNEMLNAVSPEDMRAVVDKLIEKAKAGDTQSIKELFVRTLGKPTEPDLLERLERLEKMLERGEMR